MFPLDIHPNQDAGPGYPYSATVHSCIGPNVSIEGHLGAVAQALTLAYIKLPCLWMPPVTRDKQLGLLKPLSLQQPPAVLPYWRHVHSKTLPLTKFDSALMKHVIRLSVVSKTISNWNIRKCRRKIWPKNMDIYGTLMQLAFKQLFLSAASLWGDSARSAVIGKWWRASSG